MPQTMVKILFSRRHDDLGQQLNAWLQEVSGQVTITGISVDSNEYGHCFSVMYQTGQGGHLYRAHVFYNTSHSGLEAEANRGLQAAQAQRGRFVAIGSNQYGHCLCVVEEG